MNTDFQDIKSYKKPNICENLCPNYVSEFLQLVEVTVLTFQLGRSP